MEPIMPKSAVFSLSLVSEAIKKDRTSISCLGYSVLFLKVISPLDDFCGLLNVTRISARRNWDTTNYDLYTTVW